MSEEESRPYPFIPPPRAARLPGLDAVASREQASIHYWSRRDPLNDLRTAWRANTVRHMFHLLPGEALLELGAGAGNLTQALVRVTRGECPITAATFVDPPDSRLAAATEGAVEMVALDDLPGSLAGRQFDYVVATNLLDLKHGSGSAPRSLRPAQTRWTIAVLRGQPVEPHLLAPTAAFSRTAVLATG